MPIPPTFKMQKTLGFRINIGVEVVVLFPKSIGRIQIFKVFYQIGPIKNTLLQIAGKRAWPGATQHAAGVTHGVLSGPTGPISQRGPSQQQGSGQIGGDTSQQCCCPPPLAIANDKRLAHRGRIMQPGDLLQKDFFRRYHRLYGLPLTGLGPEGDKITGMAGRQHDPDFTAQLGASYTRPMARPRINNDKGLGSRVYRVSGRGYDPQQGIIDRLRQRPTIKHDFMLKYQYRRLALTTVLDELIPALTQYVQK